MVGGGEGSVGVEGPVDELEEDDPANVDEEGLEGGVGAGLICNPERAERVVTGFTERSMSTPSEGVEDKGIS